MNSVKAIPKEVYNLSSGILKFIELTEKESIETDNIKRNTKNEGEIHNEN